MGKQQLTFKDKKEFNKAVNKHVNAILATEKAKIAQEIWKSVEPVLSTCLYEAFKFGDVRQKKFFDLYNEHIDCIRVGATTMEMYKKWCIDHNYVIYEIGQEDEYEV